MVEKFVRKTILNEKILAVYGLGKNGLTLKRQEMKFFSKVSSRKQHKSQQTCTAVEKKEVKNRKSKVFTYSNADKEEELEKNDI